MKIYYFPSEVACSFWGIYVFEATKIGIKPYPEFKTRPKILNHKERVTFAVTRQSRKLWTAKCFAPQRTDATYKTKHCEAHITKDGKRYDLE